MEFCVHPMAEHYFVRNPGWLPLAYGGDFRGLPIDMTARGAMTLPKGKAPIRYGRGTPDAPYGYAYDEQSLMTTLSFSPATGIFKGTSKVYYDYSYENGKIVHKVLSVPYSGIMLQDENGRLIFGAGANQVTDSDPTMKTYKIKWAGHVEIY